jgi:hypothetical protein
MSKIIGEEVKSKEQGDTGNPGHLGVDLTIG